MVILLTNGIEFVVMAARTRHGQTKESLTDNVDLVLRCSYQFVECVGGREALQNKSIMSWAYGRFIQPQFLIQTRISQEVSRNMLPQQLVVRHIFIECTNQIIPVLIRKWNNWIALAAKRFGVTHPVHPVPCPAFTKVWRRQELLHCPFDCCLSIL